jgi:hypothetical protein
MPQLIGMYMYAIVIIFVITDSGADAISKKSKDTCSSRPIAICSQSSASNSGKYIRNILR